MFSYCIVRIDKTCCNVYKHCIFSTKLRLEHLWHSGARREWARLGEEVLRQPDGQPNHQVGVIGVVGVDGVYGVDDQPHHQAS